MRIALIDDEKQQLNTTKELIDCYFLSLSLKAETDTFLSGEAFLESFIPLSYSIVFLDIYMNGMNGVQTAAQIRTIDSKCILIFLTSSDDYMPQAFGTHAFDYLVKPIVAERLHKVLTDALQLLPQSEPSLSVISDGIEIIIPFSRLVGFHTNGHYSELVDADGNHFLSYITFTQLTNKLNKDSRFLQISRGVMVNMDHIISFDENSCYLTGMIDFPVTKRNVRQYEQLWRNYIFSRLHSTMDKRSLS